MDFSKFLEQNFDDANEALVVIDKDLKIAYSNKESLYLLGEEFSRNYTISLNDLIFYNPQNSQKISNDNHPLSQALMGNFDKNKNLILDNKNKGTISIVSLTSSSLSGLKGESIYRVIKIKNNELPSDQGIDIVNEKINLEGILRRRSEKLELINSILRRSLEADTIEGYFNKIIKDICLFIRFDFGLLYKKSKKYFKYEKINYFHSDSEYDKYLRCSSVPKYSLERDMFGINGLAGNITFTKDKGDILTDTNFDQNFLNLRIYSSIAIPVQSDGEFEYLIILHKTKTQNKTLDLAKVNAFFKDISQIVSNGIFKFEKEKILINIKENLEKNVEDKEKSLIDLAKIKEEFIAKIGHELRTPLNAIIGYNDIMTEDTRTQDYEELPHYQKKIKFASNSLLSMVNNLINISDVKYTKVKKTKVNLLSFLVEIENSFQNLTHDHSNQLFTCFASEIDEIYSDQDKLKIIMDNIISNACKYTKGGVIKISMECDFSYSPTRAIFSVIDDGCGIDRGKIDEIFSAFSQTDNSYTRQYDGLGVGLHLSKLYADIIGAEISIESILNKGTTVKVSVPVK